MSDIPTKTFSADVTRAVPFYDEWGKGFTAEVLCRKCGAYNNLHLTDKGFQCAGACPDPDALARVLEEMGVRG